MNTKNENIRKPRNLSGIFFRHQNKETGKWENWCFEDLPADERMDKIKEVDETYLKSLVNILSDTIVRLGDELDIVRE